MKNIFGFLAWGKEFQYFSIKVKELFFWGDSAPTEFLFQIILHIGIFLRNPFSVDFGCPLIISVLFWRSLRHALFFIKLASVFITVVEIDGSAINFYNFSDLKCSRSEKFPICIKGFLPLEEDALGDSWILFFFFVDGDGVIFQVEHNFDFSIPGIFWVAFNDTFLEETIKSKNMTIKSNPIGLIEFRGVRIILGGKMIMSGGDESLAGFFWFLELFFTRKNILGGLYVVNIPIKLLLLWTHLSVVLFEFLGWSKTWKEGIVWGHKYIFVTYEL